MNYLMCLRKSMFVFGMLFLFTLVTTPLTAQNISVKRSHAINTASDDAPAAPATGTLDVVAIMVEFQPDTNRFTTGTGIFGPGGLPFLENAEDTRIDPLPHNRDYFEAHLEFTKNYYEQASDGQLTLNYRVLPKVYRLNKEMAAYSPTGETFTNEKVAMLVRDAWNKVEEKGGFDASGLDPESTAFVIFHAGVGRDVELTGTSLTITPQDIPSLYLRKQDLGNLLDEPGFNGIPVNGGDFRITNSLIIPRTESRPGLDITETEFVFPLSINGLLTASIGSHLGLPDLFNTEDGTPAIGRFGLMDGAGFFAYNGLLPPEPSAWEKIFLGWQNPVDITTDRETPVELAAASMNSSDNIARYRISASEYFLVENRHRDPDGTGLTLTIRDSDGIEHTRTFTNADDAFIFQDSGFDTLLPPGVVVDADNFDFSLPGGRDIGADGEEDTDDDRILNGGMLIWHIDEGIIQSNLDGNGVNANRFRKGVDLEEADGAQDIGPGIPGSIDNSVAFGFAFDFWWSGNNYSVTDGNRETSLYENRFAPDTRPDNNSNSGARSYFEFYDFSGNLPVASFKIKPSLPENAPRPVFSNIAQNRSYFSPLSSPRYRSFPLSLSVYSDKDDRKHVVIPYETGTDLLQLNSGERQTLSGRRAGQPFTDNFLISSEINSTETTLLLKKWEQADGTFTLTDSVQIAANPGLLSSEDGQILEADFSRTGIDLNTFTADPAYRNEEVQQSRIADGDYSVSSGSTVRFPTAGNSTTVDISPESARAYTGTISGAGGNTLYFILEDHRLLLVDFSLEEPVKVLYESEHRLNWPAIADVNEDGSPDFIFTDQSGEKLLGINSNGGFLNYFPLQLQDGRKFTGTPLLADTDNDDRLNYIVSVADSLDLNIRVYNHEMKEAAWSPLYVGGLGDGIGSIVNPVLTDSSLVAVSPAGDIKAWAFPSLKNAVWPYTYGPDFSNKVWAPLQNAGTPEQPFKVLNKKETYNWPNPADDFTHIRFELSEPGGTVEIKIAGLSGRVIYENRIESTGGQPEEFRINTSPWASGGYFALIKATVNGETETQLIKIGVVH